MYKNMDINKIDELIDEVELIDVRSAEEYAAGHIKGARNLEMMSLMFNHDQFLDKDKEYYLYCESGVRSLNVAQMLDQEGYRIINLQQGYSGYNNNNR